MLQGKLYAEKVGSEPRMPDFKTLDPAHSSRSLADEKEDRPGRGVDAKVQRQKVAA